MKEIRLTDSEKKYLKKEVINIYFVGFIFILIILIVYTSLWATGNSFEVDGINILPILLTFFVVVVLWFSYRASKEFIKDLHYSYKVISETPVKKFEDKSYPSSANIIEDEIRESTGNYRGVARHWIRLGKFQHKVTKDFFDSCNEKELVEVHKAKFSESIFVIKKMDTDKFQVLFPE